MKPRSAEKMHVIVLFFLMAVGIVVFSFVYAVTTLELLTRKTREGFQDQRAKRLEERTKQNAKMDSILYELRSWRRQP